LAICGRTVFIALMLAMSLNEFPKSVTCVGGILCDSDKGNGEQRDVADTTLVIVEFPSGAMIHLAGSTVNERGIEDVIRGQKANLLFGGGKVKLEPERPFVDEIESKDETPPDSGEESCETPKELRRLAQKQQGAELRHRVGSQGPDDRFDGRAVISKREDDAFRLGKIEGHLARVQDVRQAGSLSDILAACRTSMHTSCAQKSEPEILSLNAMATRFELVLYGSDPMRLRAAGEEALQEIERLEAQLSFYRGDSEIRFINDNAARGAVKVEPRLFRLLRLCAIVSEATAGAFDVTVGPLMRAWQFVNGHGALPSRGETEAARSRVGSAYIEFDDLAHTVRFSREGMEIDLGACGKGFAIQRAAALLEENGVASALIQGGTSSAYAIGSLPLGSAWRIRLADPFGDEVTPIVVDLCNRGLSVSAIHGKFFELDGKRYGHVIDPRSGQVVSGATAAAVSGPSPTECEALSTALLVRGPSWLSEMRKGFPGYDGWVV
jgi:thiamine biosynthesis lipoprotein